MRCIDAKALKRNRPNREGVWNTLLLLLHLHVDMGFKNTNMQKQTDALRNRKRKCHLARLQATNPPAYPKGVQIFFLPDGPCHIKIIGCSVRQTLM